MAVTIESCCSINTTDLIKAIKKIIIRNYSVITEEKELKLIEDNLKKFSINGQTFEYTNSKAYFGIRWYFLCPECKKRYQKLFLPPIGSKRKRIYGCAICHNLKYESSVTEKNNIFKRVIKPLKRLKKIEDKIYRGHLKVEKLSELLKEYDAIEKSLKDMPEYKAFIFKKKNNLI